MATDLAGDMVNYYMPSEASWAEYEVIEEVPSDIADAVKALVEDRERKLFDLLDQSNLNDIKPQIMFEPASHGTCALYVDRGHIAQPIYIEVVPPHQLYITPGHLGYLDRFREIWTAAEFLPALLLGMDLSDSALAAKIKKPGTFVKVCWGFWLDWSDPGAPVWKREVTVDQKLVSKKEETIGPINGGCPLLVGRFNPQPGRPWGRGPGRKALPDLLSLNKVEEVILGKLDEQLDPAWSYIDDGILNLRNGIEGGQAYPRRSDRMPEPLLAPNSLDYGFYTKEEMLDRIRVAFYQDGPRQRGDTPPTASQWIDERRRVQNRLGKPSAPLFTEVFLPLIQRTEFIAVQNGLLPDAITLNGRSINVKPISPLQRSQNQDKAMTSRSNLDLVRSLAGDQAGEVVDLMATFIAHIEATGDELTKIKKKENNGETPPAG
jgi:hypothetical protein